ncbi:MAG: aspartate/tyrosine/aromatic aminotransferase [Phycisphaeraceae bacterium]|nr:aspartate/tyrosine/aromatic aminotransferase [Phycisphaeraceae bacterium]
MFDSVPTAPPDPILGLTDAFKADPNPDKINLGVGVYQDETGHTPILDSVTEARKRIIAAEKSKTYMPITGDPAFGRHTQSLLLGADHALVDQKRILTAHCPGGTGALRIAGEYLARLHRGATIHISDPTWANHESVFGAAGLPIETYDYLAGETISLDFEAMLESIEGMARGDVILLHGCCHNPTGIDLSSEQWRTVAERIRDQGLLPLVDLAYQGFADGLNEDAGGLRILASIVPEMIICSSYSKNFGLYNERVGALSIIASSTKAAEAVFSQIKTIIRANYSNPPAHGAAIVTTILDDAQLRKRWEVELAEMRTRINDLRRKFAEALAERRVKLIESGNDFLNHQRGMFSYSGLNREQVTKLRREQAVYIVGSGRINIAGINDRNLVPLCDAIAAVTCAR